jgi:hypothetical protein
VPTMVEIGTYEGWRDRLLEFYPLSVSNREKKLLARRAAALRKPEDRFGDSLSTTVRDGVFPVVPWTLRQPRHVTEILSK